LGLFLLFQIWRGTLYWYINPRFTFLMVGAALVFLVLAGSILILARHEGEAGPTSEPVNDHDDGSGSGLRRRVLLAMAVPLALGILVPARPLGASAVATRGLAGGGPGTARLAGQPQSIPIAAATRTVLDWVRAFNYAPDPDVYVGQEADVIGFVYHDSRLQPGQFLVARFTITCCVADAFAIGMVVDWPEAEGLEANSWVRVRGPVAVSVWEADRIPRIEAVSVDPADEPVQPYLTP
jgi:uncharacterized repeat protein (TIGR03943 family)